MGQFLVGRQPIFDENLHVHGYELLFRSPVSSCMAGDAKTADVLVHAGLDLGLDNLVGTKLAYINATRSFIVGELPIGLPAEKTVIELLEDIGHDDEVVAGCRRLVDEGYLLALDDYVFLEGDMPLVELASIVKLDVLAMPVNEFVRQAELCSRFNVRLLAEKVETAEQLVVCRELGFDLFQGHLLSRPREVTGHALSPSHLTCLRLIEKLCDEDVSAHDVASIIETDPGLSYRFLRAAGRGPIGGFARQLSSVREGVVLLGTRRVRNWASLMLLADTHDGCEEQLSIAMVRARMSELMAEAVHPELCGSAFTVGLLSALDLLLNVPLPEIVENLAITDELVAALLEHGGELGRILHDVLAWELGGEGFQGWAEEDLAVVENCYLGALAWAREIASTLT